MRPEKIKMNCKICKVEFLTHPYRLKANVKYCSRACHYADKKPRTIKNYYLLSREKVLKRAHERYLEKCGGKLKGHLSLKGEMSPRWKGGKPKCLDCGKQTSNYDKKRCFGDAMKYRVANRKIGVGGYKGGYENKKLNNHKRRAYLLGAEGSHTLQEWEALKKKYDYMCLCCKKQEPEIKLTEDHIMPLIKGGSNYISNIQPLCRSCNCKKHTDTTDYSNEFGLARISVA